MKSHNKHEQATAVGMIRRRIASARRNEALQQECFSNITTYAFVMALSKKNKE